MNIAIDYGNSSAKVGVFDGHELVERKIFTSPEQLRPFLQNFSGDCLIISSVSQDAAEVASWGVHIKKRFILTSSLPLPIENRYSTPKTLGVDRLAGVCGAQALFPKTSALVIDAGTCITFDFLDSGGNFLGGAISPGLRMRFQAVHTFTKRLPQVEPKGNSPLIGDSTESCIQSGVENGLVAEIDGIVSQYRSLFPDLKVILTGGDVPFFENRLKAPIFAVPELVLSGLNSILIHNARS
ncbi:type III pantothenate kinase [Chryseolinea sp. T2]|uniref:type III pantothenate kinase n=1 Tax=Chryseolinea sp. T2 TaxID=3129255 RepID=UPI0030773449